MTITQTIADALAARGVRRMWGVPGGGSLGLIEAAASRGIEFVLTRTECGAALAAAAGAEISAAPGAVVTGLGPGAASVTNGVAHAALDRVPLVVITDAHPPAARHVSHQRIDQPALMRPLVKGTWAAASDHPSALHDLLERALAAPPGPVHVDLAPSAPGGGPARQEVVRAPPAAPLDDEQTERARGLIVAATRPLVLVGLEARRAAPAARALVRALGAPVLTTWKAKGVIADDDRLLVGLLTGGSAERPLLEQADLILQIGLDPVELIPGSWPYRARVLDLAEAPRQAVYVRPTAELTGPLTPSLETLVAAARGSRWTAAELRDERLRQARCQAMAASSGISPEALVRTIVRTMPQGTRATIDAGAHMFPAIAGFPAQAPGDVLISNGLATMGFALPAALGSVLEEPHHPVVCMVGDGGLAMCLGELSTLAGVGSPVVVVVFNDARLSLIELKRGERRLPERALRSPGIDFAAVASGLGLSACGVHHQDELEPRLRDAFASRRPVLLDVEIDPSGYPALLRRLRG